MQCIVHSSLHLSDLWWWSSDEKPIHCDLGRTMAHHGPSWPIMAHPSHQTDVYRWPHFQFAIEVTQQANGGLPCVGATNEEIRCNT